MGRIALIDFDLLLYRSGFASQRTQFYIYELGNEDFGWVAVVNNKTEYKKWVEFHGGGDQEYLYEEVTKAEPIENYIHLMKSTIKSILFKTGSDSFIGYLTGPNNYRVAVATLQTYKGNRDPLRKPVRYEEAKEYLIKYQNAIICDDYEADDGMSMKQWGEWDKRCYIEKENTPTVICTADKDLDMVPGYHYNWIKEEMYFVTELEGMRFFAKQILTGDSTDNIPGLFRCTGVKATKKLLAPIDTMDKFSNILDYVVKIYSESFSSDKKDGPIIEAIVREIATLLWMSRKTPGDVGYGWN